MKKETKEKISKTVKLQFEQGRDRLLEEKRYNWSGDNVGYGGLHDWVRRRLGTPEHCGRCGVERKNKWFNWANISGQYKRSLEDWLYVCIRCHRKIDGRTKKVYQYSLDGKFIAVFESAQDVEDLLGFYSGAIRVTSRGKGKQKTAYGYKWYYEETKPI